MKALVPMHTFGHPCKMSELLKIANSYNLLVIEDAAESLGSYYKDKHTGNFGMCGVLSFNGNKIITTGGGGAIVTNDIDFADRLKHLSTTAKEPHKWEIKHDNIGYNYRMPAINAALGCAQMEKMNNFISHKRKVAEIYSNALRILMAYDLYQKEKIPRVIIGLILLFSMMLVGILLGNYLKEPMILV